MNCRTPSSEQTVLFTASTSDQILLHAVAQALEQSVADSFSDLCKQALQRFLLATDAQPSILLMLDLQRQISELQLRLAALEQRLTHPGPERSGILNGQLTERAIEGGDRLTATTQPQTRSEPEPVSSPRQIDPLLSRLAPLLEDF